jgi:archaellum biogenesis ATPase FlaH
MAYVKQKTRCPVCSAKGHDTSGDNLIVYEDDSKYCFACGYTVRSKEYRDGKFNEEKETIMERTSEKIISKDENNELKSKTGFCDYRGVLEATWKSLGIRFSFNQETGQPEKQFTPCTIEGQLSGYKVRKLPKDFEAPLGEVGKVCDFLGAFRRKPYHKTVVIVAGEMDLASVVQVAEDYAKKKGFEGSRFLPVSSTIGEQGTAGQAKVNYKWLDSFDEIIIGLDNDDAGKAATEALLKALPRKCIKSVEWTAKDPNEMLQAGQDKAILNALYSAKVYTSTSIIGSSKLMSSLECELMKPMIPLPPFMRKLANKLDGGIPLGSIVNIGSLSGQGKTSIVNEIVYYLLFNSPYKVGILSMELNSGQYAQALLSRHVGCRISSIDGYDNRLEYIKSDKVVTAGANLFLDEHGNDRFYLMDERDGSLEDMIRLVEELIINCNSKVIVLDPLQDILDGLPNEEQAVFMKWQKTVVNKYNVTFINICHLRKNANQSLPEDTGLDILYGINEQDFQGSSAIFKSGGVNILFARNKRHENHIERNTTYAMLDKSRHSAQTGLAGSWYYCDKTHTMWDKDDYMTRRSK